MAERKPHFHITLPTGEVAPVEFYPQTLATQIGGKLSIHEAEQQAERLRRALSFPLLHPSENQDLHSLKVQRYGDKRIKLINNMDRQASAPPPNLTLRDFEPNANVLDRLQRSTFFPVDYPVFRDLTREARVAHDREYWSRGEGKKLIDAFDHQALETIGRNYDQPNQDTALTYFEKRIEEANSVISKLPRLVRPGSQDEIELINTTSFLYSPGQMVRLALSSDVDPQLQFEVLRTLNVAELLAQNDRHSKGLRRIVGEFQGAIDDEIFDHGRSIGQSERIEIYTFLDKNTGEPLWISYSDQALTPKQLRELSDVAVLKKLNWAVREAAGTGLVSTKPRTKSLGAIVDKLIREAQRREQLLGDNYVDPSCITDLGGIKHVLLDETDLKGETMNSFINRHRELAIKTFGPETEFIEGDDTSGYLGQSEEFGFRRLYIIVSRGGHKYQLEMLFEPLPLYLTNMFKFGNIDEDTGYRNGPAHPIYEEIRKVDAAKLLYPEEVFGDKEWNKATVSGCKRKVDEILSENTIISEELPEKFITKDASRGSSSAATVYTQPTT